MNKRVLSMLLAIVMVLGIMPVNVFAADGNVAAIGETEYETLAAAVANVKNGETITLLADCAESVTIKQTASKSFTIDGSNKTYTGTITIDGNNRTTGAETLTIKNVNFVLNGEWQSGILAKKNTAVHNLTVDSCSFTGTEAKQAYGIRLYSSYNVTVSNTTGFNLYDLVYAQTAVTGFTAENVTVTDCGMGFMMPYAKGDIYFKNVTVEASGAGFGFYNYNKFDAVFEDCDITAVPPIYLDEKADAVCTITVLEGSELTAAEGETLVYVNSAENEFIVTLPAEMGEGVEGNFVAMVNGTCYATIADVQAALDDAAEDVTVVLLTDCAEDLTIVQKPDVEVTIDGNNKTMSGTITVDGKSQAYATAALTIKNVNFDATGIAAEASINLGVKGNNNTRYTSNVTVEDCTFTGEGYAKVGIKNYTGGCKNLTVENCTATGMHSLMQVKGVAGLKVSVVTIEDCKSGMSFGTSTDVVVENAKITAVGDDGYGLRFDGVSTVNVVDSCEIEAWLPVLVRKASENFLLEITGDTEMIATGNYGCVIASTGDDVDGATAPVEPDYNTVDIYSGLYNVEPALIYIAPDLAAYDLENGWWIINNADADAIAVTVSFDANGGKAVASVTVPYAGKLTELPEAERAGYDFQGWYLHGVEFNMDTVITEPITLKARWTETPDPAYSVNNETDAKLSHRTAEEGEKVYFNDLNGLDVSEIIVLDKDGDEIEIDENNKGYYFKMPYGSVTVMLIEEEIEPTFVDVDADDYYFDAVEWAVEEGITNGMSAYEFMPDGICTRAQVVTFLWRAAGEPAPKSNMMPFADVAEGAWYYDAVLWAVENGITKGMSETEFAPNATVTRGQTVTFLWRAMGEDEAEEAAQFVDVAADAYYAEAVAWAVENDITNGMTKTTFGPENGCTRGQIVTFLYRTFAK